MGPALSLDGNTLFCENNTNNPQSFYSIRTDTAWSTPSILLSASNNSHYFQETNPGKYYVSSSPRTGTTLDISELIISASDTAIEDLGVPLNASNNYEDFYISKDEVVYYYSTISKRSR